MLDDRSLRKINPWASFSIGTIGGLLTAYPPLYTFLKNGLRGAFAFVHADAFLYLTIARHSRLGFFSFDGTKTTNGFHPLWQYILTLASNGLGPSESDRLLVSSFLLSTLFNSLGMALASIAVYRYTRSFLLGLLTIPGVYYILIGSVIGQFPVWGNIDGMETGLSVFFGGLVLYILSVHLAEEPNLDQLLAQRGMRSMYFQLGLALAMLVLARLDDVFVVFSLGFTIMVMGGRFFSRVRAALLVLVPTGLLLVAYLLFNKLSVGAYMPLSGLNKAGFTLPSSVYVFLAELFPPLIDLKNSLVSNQSNHVSLALSTFRAVENIYPMLICVAYIALIRVYYRGRIEFLLPAGLSGGVVIKALYNLAYVNLWHQSQWYYGFAMLLSSFLPLILLGDPARQLFRNRAISFFLFVFYGLYVAFASGQFLFKTTFFGSARPYEYYQDRELITKALRSYNKDVKIFELGDGLTAYALDIPCIQLFAIDLDTFQAMKEGRLLHHAFERGHNVVAAFEYLTDLAKLKSSEDIRASLRGFLVDDGLKKELESFDFEMIYFSEKTRCPFIKFTPRKQAAVHGSLGDSRKP